MGDSDNEVVVVGAGPGGLFLACELALAGVGCTVLERRTHRSRESRATGLQARTLELLDMRGMVDRFLARGYPHDYYRFNLGSARIDLRCLDTNYQQLNVCPQSVTEELLEEQAQSLGARIERDAEVLDLRQDADSVELRVRGRGCERWERASWVVGYDGAQSAVRRSAGIDFPGKTYPFNVFAADVRLAKAPRDGMLVEVNPQGLVVAIDYGDGWWRMGCVEQRPSRPQDEPVTISEVRDTLARIFGYDLGPSEPRWTSRFRFHKREASAYRRGRILLGGDAAHVHAPLGAQGLNISMQDAMNLGWKLAAVARGHAPSTLLDSYEQERRAVGRRVLAATDRAMSMMMSQRIPVRMVRRILVPALTRLPGTHRVLAGQISNVALSYPPNGAGRRDTLVGSRVPDLTLRYADGRTQRLYEHFRTGQFVFVDHLGGSLGATCDPWGDRFVRVRASIREDTAGQPRQAFLCRPDGYFAWSGSQDDGAGLRAALRKWCGEPRDMQIAALDT